MSKSIAMDWWTANEKTARFNLFKEQLPPPNPYFVGRFRAVRHNDAFKFARPSYIEQHFEYIDEMMHEDRVDSIFDLFGAG